MPGLAKRLSLALLAAGLASQFAIVSAPAHHIKGATYKGTHAGGGRIEFKIADNGREIRRFKVTNVPGDGCTVEETETKFGKGFGPEISSFSHFFSRLASAFKGGGVSFDGSFNRAQRANGTLSLVAAFNPFGTSAFCDSRDFKWRARTNASPANTPECREAKREIREWTSELRKAKRVGDASRVRRAKKRLAFWRNEKQRSC